MENEANCLGDASPAWGLEESPFLVHPRPSSSVGLEQVTVYAFKQGSESRSYEMGRVLRNGLWLLHCVGGASGSRVLQ